jgi:hypothetical protein
MQATLVDEVQILKLAQRQQDAVHDVCAAKRGCNAHHRHCADDLWASRATQVNQRPPPRLPARMHAAYEQGLSMGEMEDKTAR